MTRMHISRHILAALVVVASSLFGVAAPAAQAASLPAVAPTAAAFRPQQLYTLSAEVPFEIRNLSFVEPLPLSLATSGDFMLTSTTCPTSLRPLDSCIAWVSFRPTALGTREGRFIVNNLALAGLSGKTIDVLPSLSAMYEYYTAFRAYMPTLDLETAEKLETCLDMQMEHALVESLGATHLGPMPTLTECMDTLYPRIVDIGEAMADMMEILRQLSLEARIEGQAIRVQRRDQELQQLIAAAQQIKAAAEATLASGTSGGVTSVSLTSIYQTRPPQEKVMENEAVLRNAIAAVDQLMNFVEWPR